MYASGVHSQTQLEYSNIHTFLLTDLSFYALLVNPEVFIKEEMYVQIYEDFMNQVH